MTKHKVIFVSDDEIEDYDNFVCPECDLGLVHKDYKINRKTLWYFSFIFALGFLLGVTYRWWFV